MMFITMSPLANQKTHSIIYCPLLSKLMSSLKTVPHNVKQKCKKKCSWMWNRKLIIGWTFITDALFINSKHKLHNPVRQDAIIIITKIFATIHSKLQKIHCSCWPHN